MTNESREWLKVLRESRNMMQADAAKVVGISPIMWSFIENGKRQPSVKLAQRIGKAFDFEWTRFYA